MSKKAAIPFNKPFMLGKEIDNIRKAIELGQLSGGGYFSALAERFFQEKFGVPKALLTSSCTDALEMVALLLDIKAGDEIIAPSFAFVSTVNPFVLRGAKIVFADSCSDHPNMNVDSLEALITTKTKAIVCIHYSGMACDMDRLNSICKKHSIHLVEDAAHSIDSSWKNNQQLGSIGSFGVFSFHETKNVIAGEGGMLCVNDPSFFERADILIEKGTNRKAFFKGQTDKYQWVDIGSSFRASELTAAFLMAQLEEKDKIKKQRVSLWNGYHKNLSDLAVKKHFELPLIPENASNNGHIFYLVLKNEDDRKKIIEQLKSENIQAVFHYQSLHKSPFYKSVHGNRELPSADRFSDCLLRLPLFFELAETDVDRICDCIRNHFKEIGRAHV